MLTFTVDAVTRCQQFNLNFSRIVLYIVNDTQLPYAILSQNTQSKTCNNELKKLSPCNSLLQVFCSEKLIMN